MLQDKSLLFSHTNTCLKNWRDSRLEYPCEIGLLPIKRPPLNNKMHAAVKMRAAKQRFGQVKKKISRAKMHLQQPAAHHIRKTYRQDILSPYLGHARLRFSFVLPGRLSTPRLSFNQPTRSSRIILLSKVLTNTQVQRVTTQLTSLSPNFTHIVLHFVPRLTFHRDLQQSLF